MTPARSITRTPRSTVRFCCSLTYTWSVWRLAAGVRTLMDPLAHRSPLLSPPYIFPLLLSSADGVAFYYSNSYSWGFANHPANFARSSCDTNGGSDRLCVHTGGNQVNGGVRSLLFGAAGARRDAAGRGWGGG
jgi:hypothetical protein